MATTAKKAKLTLDEIRARLGDAKKEVAVEITDDVLAGDVKGLTARITKLAKDNDLPEGWEIAKATVSKQDGYTYRYMGYPSYRNKRVPNMVTSTVMCVVGYRPYTDEELKSSGAALIKDAERAAKSRAKDLAKIKQLAAKHGIEVAV